MKKTLPEYWFGGNKYAEFSYLPPDACMDLNSWVYHRTPAHIEVVDDKSFKLKRLVRILGVQVELVSYLKGYKAV